jgi:hypothetical protein
MQNTKLEWELGPTIEDFVNSDKVVNILISPAGEGKTFGCVVAIAAHSLRCGKPIRVAIVRDTHENIKLSTARSIQDVFAKTPHLITFKNDFKQLTINGPYRIDVDLFGIDDLAALSKLQGPEYALIWLEEPAPMGDRVNAGLSEEVYNAALLRCARQSGTKARLQVSMNPADEDHWTFRRFIEEPDEIPGLPLITKQVWNVPYGENSFLSETARQAAMAAYKDDLASYTRYVKGQFATVYRGKRVAPDYNPNIHLSPNVLIPAKGLVSFAFFDSWHSPACVLGQITSLGRLVFINTLRLEGGDVRALIDNQVLPMINSPLWRDKPMSWRVGGDFTMKQHDQSNIMESAARCVEAAFPGCIFEIGPSKWDLMKRGFSYALNHNIQGMPAVILSSDNRLLHKGLNGAWHYKTDNSGNVTRTASVKPEKDQASHFCDAWANACCVLMPTTAMRDLKKLRAAAMVNKMRGQTYATGRVQSA